MHLLQLCISYVLSVLQSASVAAVIMLYIKVCLNLICTHTHLLPLLFALHDESFRYLLHAHHTVLAQSDTALTAAIAACR